MVEKKRSAPKDKRGKIILIFAAVVVAAVAALCLIHFIPRSLMPEGIIIGRIELDGEDITANADTEAVRALLKDLKTTGTLETKGAYLMAEYPVEIQLRDEKERPYLYILIGKADAYCYHPDRAFKRKLSLEEDLYAQIVGLLPSDNTVEHVDFVDRATPSTLSGLDSLDAADIAYIAHLTGEIPSIDFAHRYSGEEDIANIVSWLKGIEIKELVSDGSGADSPNQIPGAWSSYELYTFGGDVVSVGFAAETIHIDGKYYSYEQTVERPADRELRLITEPEEFEHAANDEQLSYILFNGGSKDLLYIDVPRLERMEQEGWVQMEVTMGFCGTPSSFEPGRRNNSMSLEWFKDVKPGTYRLSVPVSEPENPDDLYYISDVFILTESEVPFNVISNGESVAPHTEFAYSREWTGDGWLFADGAFFGDMLAEIAAEFPIITFADDFSVQYEDNVSFDRLFVYDADFTQLCSNEELSYLQDLPDGEYYIGILVTIEGEYIASEGESEYTGMAGIYKIEKYSAD